MPRLYKSYAVISKATHVYIKSCTGVLQVIQRLYKRRCKYKQSHIYKCTRYTEAVQQAPAEFIQQAMQLVYTQAMQMWAKPDMWIYMEYKNCTTNLCKDYTKGYAICLYQGYADVGKARHVNVQNYPSFTRAMRIPTEPQWCKQRGYAETVSRASIIYT